MHGGTQVRKSNSAYVGKRNLKSRTGRRCLQLFKDPLNKVMVLPAAASVEVRNRHSTILQSR
jgi:hypothetical protein